VTLFLGVDGGGTKTEFALVDAGGTVRGRHVGGPAYYLETGLDALRALIEEGIRAALSSAGASADAITFGFLGLPSYGEDSRLQPALDALPASVLGAGRWRCGNDMVCGWAGAFAAHDGINVVAGTGSIAYGRYREREARAGGWGELIGDEASAYWIAARGMNAFSRMSDGRLPRGPLYDLVRAHAGLSSDLDLCAAVYGTGPASRSGVAGWAPLIARAARAGDAAARAVFDDAARELVALVVAVRGALDVPSGASLPVSWSGGVFGGDTPLLEEFGRALAARGGFDLRPPRLRPAIGAAAFAAQLARAPLDSAAIERLASA
jgi:N-acetylglucosamine kinase-like BadF-type ATPase